MAEPPRPRRVFLDTSALIAGLISSRGAAREVLRLGEAEAVVILLSEQVLVEADRVFEKKFPGLAGEYRNFIRNVNPVLVDDPTRAEVKKAAEWIDEADAPILAAALKSDADCIVTWDKRHFLNPRVRKNVEMEIFTPGEFIESFHRGL